jgi:hypothetical protein
MIGKRGDIELQFNWVFVIVVGTLILAIAAGFVFRQKQNSDIIISNQLISFTRSVITISSATPGKAEPQDLQKDIGVTCDPDTCTGSGCTSDIYVMPRTLNARMDTKVEAIFSPAVLKGSKLGAWSMEWDMPFHVYNFLYLSSDEVRYVFVKSPHNNVYAEGDARIQALYDDMPDIMGRKELVGWEDVTGIKKANNYKVRFVFATQTDDPITLPFPTLLKSMQAKDLTAIRFIPNAGVGNDFEEFELGTIMFYQKNPDSNEFVEQGEQSNYFGEPLIFGAVFSNSRDFYVCNLEKSKIRLSLVSSMYRRMLDTLIYDPNVAACKLKYGEAINPSEQLMNARSLQASELYENAKLIAAVNTALMYKSCPLY